MTNVIKLKKKKTVDFARLNEPFSIDICINLLKYILIVLLIVRIRLIYLWVSI